LINFFRDYISIIGNLIGIIGMKKIYSLKSTFNSTESQSNISELNQNIELIYNIIYQTFKFFMLKQRYEFKKEALTSTIFYNTNIINKKVKIDCQKVEGLIISLKNAIKKKKSGGSQLLNKDDYIILKDGPDEKIKDSNLELNLQNVSMRKVTIFIDTKFVRNFRGFEERLKVKEKSNLYEEDKEILRCDICSAIAPKAFININNQEKNSLIKRFIFKAQKCWRYTSVIRNSGFSKAVIYDNINKLMDGLNNCVNADDESVAETAKKIRTLLDTAITKSQSLNISTTQIFNEFTNDLIKHIKMQTKHYNRLKKLEKITNDIQDAREEYTNKVSSFNNELEMCKKNLISIQDFGFTITEREEVDKLKSELSVNGKSFPQITGNLLKFKQV